MGGGGECCKKQNSNWFQNRKHCCNIGNIILAKTNHPKEAIILAIILYVATGMDLLEGGGFLVALFLVALARGGAIFHDKAKNY